MVKKKKHPRIFWCCISRGDGAILAEVESILSRPEEEAVVETAEQLLSQKLPLHVGGVMKQSEAHEKSHHIGKSIKRSVIRSKEKLFGQRHRHVPVAALLMVAAETPEVSLRKPNRKHGRKKQELRKRRVAEEPVKERGVESHEGGGIGWIRERKATERLHKLLVSTVYDPRSCSYDQAKLFLEQVSAVVHDNELDWATAKELELQEFCEPIIGRWMEDVKHLEAVAHLQRKVDQLTAQMQSNIRQLASNTETAEDLYGMSEDLLDKTKVFKKKSRALLLQKRGRNVKYGIAIGSTVTAMFGVAILVAIL